MKRARAPGPLTSALPIAVSKAVSGRRQADMAGLCPG